MDFNVAQSESAKLQVCTLAGIAGSPGHPGPLSHKKTVSGPDGSLMEKARRWLDRGVPAEVHFLDRLVMIRRRVTAS